MTYAYHERLSALDSTFLKVEDPNAHMHVGAVALFEAALLTAADGTTAIDAIRHLVEASIHRFPRYRQRLAWVPWFNHPVWVDDPRFNLLYHVRHVSLPKPGDERQLKRLTGRIMSQQLDRGKPLWELWVVDGVEGGRLALITKAHHCMIDGVGSVELTGAMMRATAESETAEPPRWIPRPVPAPTDLFTSELWRRVGEPIAAAAAAVRALRHPLAALESAGNAIAGVGEALGAGLRPSSATPFNVEIGPHRRFDWLAMDLGAVREIKDRIGGTVNDVVLAIVAGALRRILRTRGMTVEELDVRAMIPVNVRTEAQRERAGNQVSMMVTSLPLAERDPQLRLQRVIEAVSALKRSRQSRGVQTLESVSDVTFSSLFTTFARLASAARPYNLIVTNVPGPQFPTYFLGAQMQAAYPLVPLMKGQALGIALFSYNGGLFWGFNADWDAVPDLHDLVQAIEREFTELRRAAANAPAAAGKRPTSRRKHRSPSSELRTAI